MTAAAVAIGLGLVVVPATRASGGTTPQETAVELVVQPESAAASDGVRTSDPGDPDLDHVAPLEEARPSGASRWTAAQRGASADDLRAEPATGAARALAAAWEDSATQPVAVVYAGSSTTAGAFAAAPARRYVDLLTAAVQAAHPSPTGTESQVAAHVDASGFTRPTAPGVHGFNLGEGGTHAGSYFLPAERDRVVAIRPRVVLHMIGSNDFANGSPPETYEAQLEEVTGDLRDRVPGLVQILVQPYERWDRTSYRYPWSAYRDAQARVAAEHPDDVLFVDLSPDFYAIGIPSTDPRGYMDADRVHMRDGGHTFMAGLLADALIPSGVAPRSPAPAPAADSLRRGAVLAPGASLVSANGRYRATMQADGNVVVYAADGRPVWATMTSSRGASLAFQPDGNVVLRSTGGRPLWFTSTFDTRDNGGGARELALGDDGNLVLYRTTSKSKPIWFSGWDSGRRLDPTRGDVLLPGMQLSTGQAIYSPSRRYGAVMQADGNFVVYAPGNRPLWSARTSGADHRLIMQPDGNLVVYTLGSRAPWNARVRAPGARTVLQENGHLVVYRPDGTPAFSTG